MWPESDCTRWLDSQAQNSVIDISLGSLAHVSRAQIEEVATGLAESKQPFIWVLRPDLVEPGTEYILPKGFVEETRDQGLAVEWSSQLQVLSHPSLGGFLTHCGWNSILESLSFGVPMLAFPLFTDQCTNRWMIVEEWEVAMDLSRSTRSFQNCKPLVGREEVARTIKIFMGEEAGRKLRLKVEHSTEVVKKAVLDRGASGASNAEYEMNYFKPSEKPTVL